VTDVLIRDVPRKTSICCALRQPDKALLCRATYAMRSTPRRPTCAGKRHLSRTAERLWGRRHVPAEQRRPVLNAVSDARTERAKELSQRSKP